MDPDQITSRVLISIDLNSRLDGGDMGFPSFLLHKLV